MTTPRNNYSRPGITISRLHYEASFCASNVSDMNWREGSWGSDPDDVMEDDI